MLSKLQAVEKDLEVRDYTVQAKRHYYQINVTKSAEKRQPIFEKQLRILKRSIEQTGRVLKKLTKEKASKNRKTHKLRERLEQLLPMMEKVYAMTKRRELDGEAVPNDEKLFSIYEEHTNIIVKGQREVEFGHKVNLSTGRSGIILGCEILDGNPADSTLYQRAIEGLKTDYDVEIRAGRDRRRIRLAQEPQVRARRGYRQHRLQQGRRVAAEHRDQPFDGDSIEEVAQRNRSGNLKSQTGV